MYTVPGIYQYHHSIYYLRYPRCIKLGKVLIQPQRTFSRNSVLAAYATIIEPMTSKPSKKRYPEYYI